MCIYTRSIVDKSNCRLCVHIITKWWASGLLKPYRNLHITQIVILWNQQPNVILKSSPSPSLPLFTFFKIRKRWCSILSIMRDNVTSFFPRNHQKCDPNQTQYVWNRGVCVRCYPNSVQESPTRMDFIGFGWGEVSKL